MNPDEIPGTIPTPFLKKHATLIIGAVVAGLNALVTLIGAGGLDDGFQWNPDGILIGGPILGALGLKTQVWSQESVDELAPKSVQQAVLRDRRRR